MDFQRADQGGKPQNHCDVEYVRAHHIAQGDAALSEINRLGAHHHFRGAGAKGHYGKSDDQRGYPGPQSQAGTAANQTLGSKAKHNQANEQ